MPSRSRIILYWLLLLVPTLLLGVSGWWLVVREEERIVQAGERARQERISLVLENIDLFLEEVKTAVMEGLAGLPGHDPVEAMEAWRDNNPFIGEIFLWRPGRGLVFPHGDRTHGLTLRFGAYLDPRETWTAAISAVDTVDRNAAGAMEEAAAARPSPRREVQQLAQQERYSNFMRQQQLLRSYQMDAADADARAGDLSPEPDVGTVADGNIYAQRGAFAEDSGPSQARSRATPILGATAMMAPQAPTEAGGVPTAKGSAMADITPLEVTARGWIPPQSGDNSSVLGWVQLNPGGEVRGAELDRREILRRLEIILAEAVSVGEAMVLLGSNREPLYAAGGMVPPQAVPAQILPLGDLLPNGSLAVYPLSGGLGGRGGFMIISLLLLGVFLAAILSGGSLLLWQAHQNARDARRKSGFVSNVSHELKTPLTTLRMYADLLADPRNTDESRRQRYLNVIRSETERLTRLVNNVLDFSRLDRQQKSYRTESFDLSALAGDLLEMQGPRIREAGLEIIREGMERPLIVRADRDALEQVCLNLLDNAVKYASGGGELTVAADAVDGHARLRFMDRGPGVPSTQTERIFDEFHRIDDSLTAAHPGCGLGLSIARQLLRGQGGDLCHEDRPGGGSVFKLTIPVLQP